ncbi:MAG: oligosaccharide flippase family protein, partial [Chloroflexota bacterium]
NAAAWTIGYSDAIRVFTALTGIGLIVDVYGNMCSDQLLAQERMVITSVVETVHILLRIGAVALALLGGYGLFGLYIAGILAGAARSVAFGVALARTGVRPQFPLDTGIAWPLLVNSSPLAASAVLSLAYQQADKLFSTRLLDEASTGYLTAAFVVITGVIELLNSTVLIATYPVMSRYAGQVFGFIVGKLVFFTVLVTLPIALTLSLFAPEVTLPLFGADFAPTAQVLRALIWYALAAMVVNVFAQGMMVQNRQRRLLVVRASGLALNLTLNLTLLLAFDMGIMGLVYASVTAELVVLTILLATFRQDGLETRRLLGRAARAVALIAQIDRTSPCLARDQRRKRA